MSKPMKQIVLKNGVLKIDSCLWCPCANEEYHVCNLDSFIKRDTQKIPEKCPLEDLKQEFFCPKCGHKAIGNSWFLTCEKCGTKMEMSDLFEDKLMF